jgi:alpha-glucosidase
MEYFSDAKEVGFRLIAVLLFTAATAWPQAGLADVSSPDGRLTIAFQTVEKATTTPGEGRIAPVRPPTTASGQLVYTVSFQGKPLIDQSALGLDLQGQVLLGPNVRIVNTARSQTDETYKLIAGKASSVRNHFNALRVDLEETASQGRKLVMEARAYDAAVAFRYVVPDQTPLRDFRLVKENTEFRISKDAMTYALYLPNYRSAYESEFFKIAISGISTQGGVAATPQLIGLPLLMEVPGVAWLGIAEADLRDYAGMYLMNPSPVWGEHWFEARLSPNVNEPDISVSGSLPHHSAWRVLLVGTEPGRLIESNVITSLNPESAIKDTSWIRPGRALWNWWNGSIGADGKSAFTTENMKYYADFAAKSGLEYVLVDGSWSPVDDITKMNGTVDIPELVRYAGAKGVKVWIWCHWSAVDRQLEEAFPLFEKWGVAGIKVDYMMRDDQAMIGFYYRVAEKAAQHHLMVDFHGACKPTGLERTWPNVLGYEAILGMEQSKATGRDTPDQHVMFPFTRMLAGMMDYTPGSFHNVTKADFEPREERTMVMGTRAHQLAMYAVFESPLQMVSDYPAALEGQPGFDFIKNIAPTWDETRVVNGLPGEYVTIARRRGNEWFLGSMTNWSSRQLDIPLTFLGSGRYTAEIYADSPDADRFPKNVTIQKQPVDRTAHLKAQLAPGGGYAVRFRPNQ